MPGGPEARERVACGGGRCPHARTQPRLAHLRGGPDSRSSRDAAGISHVALNELDGFCLAPPRLLRARPASPMRLGSQDAHHAHPGLSLLRYRSRHVRRRAGRGQLWQRTTFLRAISSAEGRPAHGARSRYVPNRRPKSCAARSRPRTSAYSGGGGGLDLVDYPHLVAGPAERILVLVEESMCRSAPSTSDRHGRAPGDCGRDCRDPSWRAPPARPSSCCAP
jgi:hypothetical protein